MVGNKVTKETKKSKKSNKIKKNSSLLLRISMLAIALYPLFAYEKFINHFKFYFSNQIIHWTITDSWIVVLVHVAFFTIFIFFLRYRKKTDWKGKGMYVAFVISLFVEMYGIPLTMHLTSNYFFKDTFQNHNVAYSTKILGVGFGFNDIIIYGGIIIILGVILVILGWKDIYKNIEKMEIVDSGIYRVSRHPQYLGIILIVLGWTVVWPSVLTFGFGGILTYYYTSLCIKEEKENHSKKYIEYKKKTPFFF